MKKNIENQSNNEKLKIYGSFIFFMLFCLLISLSQKPQQISANDGLPNDPYYPEQWYLHSKAVNGNNWEAAINLLQMIDTNPVKDTIRVVTIDSGAQANHPELTAALWTNLLEIPGNNIDDDGNGYIDDVHGCAFTPEDDSCEDNINDLSRTQHGTGTAGIIASAINNLLGIAANGLGFNVELVPLKVIQSQGVANYSDIRQALEYVLAMDNVDVVNISIAGWASDSSLESLNLLIDQISAKGTIIVAGSGNSYPQETTVGWPASHPKVIAVGGFNQNGDRIDYSNFGENLDLVAPAQNIRTLCYEDSYCLQGGTSFASPQVALAVAFIKAYHPEYSFEQVQELLHQSSGSSFSQEYGYGKLDYYAITSQMLLNNRSYLPAVSN